MAAAADGAAATSLDGALKLAVYCVALPAVAVPGIVVSAMSILVFSKPKMRSSLNTYLLGLSCFDLGVLLCSLLLYPPMTRCEMSAAANGTSCVFFFRVAIVAYPMSLVAQFGSVWTCVAISIDRFIAVNYPLHSRILCTPHRAVVALTGITLAAFVYHIPAMLELAWTDDGQLVPTDMRENKTYYTVYKVYMYMLVLFLAPWALMILLNYIVIRAVRRAYIVQRQLLSAQSAHRSTRAQDDRERRCTKLALFIIVTFLAFNLPALCINLLEQVDEARRRSWGDGWWSAQQAALFTGNLLVCINSATNFLIYTALNQRFRTTCLNMFCPCLRRIAPQAFSYASVAQQPAAAQHRGSRDAVDSAPGGSATSFFCPMSQSSRKSSTSPSQLDARAGQPRARALAFNARALVHRNTQPLLIEEQPV